MNFPNYLSVIVELTFAHSQKGIICRVPIFTVTLDHEQYKRRAAHKHHSHLEGEPSQDLSYVQHQHYTTTVAW